MKSIYYKNYFILSFIIIFSYMFSFSYFLNENPIYMWDYGAYYEAYINISSNIGFLNKLNIVFNSIYNDDYNLFLAYFISPFFSFFETSRYGYLMAIITVYYLPFIFIFIYIFKKYLTIDKNNYLDFLYPLCILFYSVFWMALIRGMPDIAGLIFIALSFLILLKTDYLIKAKMTDTILYGFLLWMSFLCRRWYLYSVILLLVLPFLYASLILFYNKSLKKSFFHIFRNYFLSGLILFVMVVIFQRGLFLRILTTDYSEIYKAYSSSFMESMNTIYSFFGNLYLALFLLGMVFAFFYKNKNIIFCCLFCLILTVWFTQTQMMGIQHVLPLAFFGLFSILYAVQNIAKILPKFCFWIVPICFTIFSIFNFFYVFQMGTVPTSETFKQAYVKSSVPPLKIENFDEYKKLVLYLNTLADDDSSITIVGSSLVFNGSLLAAVDRGTSQTPTSKFRSALIEISHVDERDGLSLLPVKSDYAVVADPIAFHLPKDHQHVVSYIAESILNNTGLGEDYEKLPVQFKLADGYTAYIYKRIRPLSQGMIKKIEKDMQVYYPNWVWDGANRIYIKP